MWSATSLALARSGAPLRPTANEWSLGHQASSRPPLSTLVAENLRATALMTDESSPPDSSTP